MNATEVKEQVRIHYEQMAPAGKRSPGSPLPEIDQIGRLILTKGAKTFFDVGCGWGRNSAAVGNVAERVVCLELAWNQLVTAKNLLNSGQLIPFRFVQGNCINLPFLSDSADVVLCTSVLFHLPEDNDRIASLKEIKRITKKEGVVLIDSQNLWYPRNFLKAIRMILWSKLRGLYWAKFGDSYIIRKNPATGEETATYARFQSVGECASEIKQARLMIVKKMLWTKDQKPTRCTLLGERVSYFCRPAH